jgi:hypothetical protein
MGIRKQGLVLISAAVLTVWACGDDSDDSKNSGGRDALGACEDDAPSSCKADELEDFTSCSTSKCDDEYKDCLGDDYKDGKFGGECGEYQECITACDCGDTDCISDCGAPSSDCTSCLIKASQCVATECDVPSCFDDEDQGDGDEGDGDEGDGDEGDGDEGDGDEGDGDEGDGDGDTIPGGEYDCDDLKNCCDGLTGSKKTSCETAYDAASGQGDLACGVVYSGFQEQGTCD